MKPGLTYLFFGVTFFWLQGLGHWGALGLARAEESHPGISLESMYSEAVLAYNKNQLNEALRILAELIKIAPKNVEALELQALTLKAKGDDSRSLETYRKLLQMKPAQERGTYHFEIGVILNRQKKFDQAKGHFEEAIRLKVNETPSHLFLGMMAFSGADYKSAEDHFRKVKAGGSQELKLVSGYYLGLIHFKNGFTAGGTGEFVAVRAIAVEMRGNPMAKSIREGVDKVLAPFDRPRWFATLSGVGQYDSNISQIAISGGAPSNKATPKLMFSGIGGWQSAAARPVQLVLNYRGSYNKNLNPNTSSYEFFTNVSSMMINFFPLSATTGGLKAEGSFTFQNQVEGGVFGPYSLAGEFGPFFRSDIDVKTQVMGDVSFKPAKYYPDSGLNSSGLAAHLSIRRQTSSRYFNPGISGSYESNPALSGDFRYKAIGGGVYNQARLTGSDNLQMSADYLSTSYAEASVPRQDRNWTFRANLTHNLNVRLAILADFTYIMNASNLDSIYSYNRFMTGVGMSWNM